MENRIKQLLEKVHPDLREVAVSLWQEIEDGKKIGFDVRQHWKDMQASLEKE